MALDVGVGVSAGADAEVGRSLAYRRNDVGKRRDWRRAVRVDEREHVGVQCLEAGGDRRALTATVGDRVDRRRQVGEPFDHPGSGVVHLDPDLGSRKLRCEFGNVGSQPFDVRLEGRNDDSEGGRHYVVAPLAAVKTVRNFATYTVTLGGHPGLLHKTYGCGSHAIRLMEFGLVLVWLVALLALGAAALPLSALIFRDLADRGAAFAIPLALATIGVVAYVVGQVSFGLPALAAGLLVLIVGSFVAADRVDFDYEAFLAPALVFTAAFLLIVLVRAADPAIDALAGEKFLDFGLLQSVLRTNVLPPEDMWFAGEPVQYYYGGQLIAGLLTMLTGTGAAYAYNLSLAAFFGAFVVAGYGLSSNIAATYGVSPRIAGLLGAFFVGIAANLHTAARLVLWILPDGLAGPAASALGLSAESANWVPADFSYWSASRVIPGSINEFPLFAWMNGDLHAHMMSTPFLLLVAGVCLAYWVTPEDDRRRRQLLLVGVVPPIAGLLTVVNTWSFPSAIAIVGLTVLFAPAHPATLLPESWRWSTGGDVTDSFHSLRAHARRIGFTAPVAIGVFLVGVVWSLPFLLSVASSQPIGIHFRDTPLGPLLLVHGAFLVGFVPYLAVRARTLPDRPALAGAAVVGTAVLVWLVAFYNLSPIGAYVLPAVALLGPILLVAWLLLMAERDVGMETLLILAGVGLVLIVEFVNVDSTPNISGNVGEWNTLFKAYAQVWALWAPAAGVVFARLMSTGRSASATVVRKPDWWPTMGTALTIVVLVSTAAYAGLALPTHLDGGADTLDGLEYVESQHPGEAEAIEWLSRLDGQPNIVTAPACACNDLGTYRWVSAPSSLTGVPTVAGWGAYGGHEYIYRSQEAFDERVAQVATIYTSSDAARAERLDRYDVEYVYVGPNERKLYDSITVDSDPALEKVFENSAVTIYEVTDSGSG